MDIFELLSYGEEDKILVNNSDNALVCRSDNSLNHAIISLGAANMEKEIEKFQLIIKHKDETIENLKREIELLREMNSILKSEK